ncbi:MAG TPA: 50S ribosomal protein L11 methyltransferase [Thermoanaerobaculia bacterium]
MTFSGKLSNASVVELLNYHRRLLADEQRTSAYERAIAATVRPGDIVIDLGCGSGILSFFACRAGARRVYAIDELPVIELARELAASNGLADRIVFINRRSRDAQIDERADVIVTEIMGNNGFDEQIVSATAHAARAWLRPGGTLLPRSVEMHAAPVDVDAIGFWRGDRYRLDFASVAARATQTFHAVRVAPDQLLAPGQRLTRAILGEEEPSLRGTAEWRIERAATLHALAVWFRAELTEAIDITNDPVGGCPSWKHSLFPLPRPFAVRAGEVVRAELQTFDGTEWRWRVARADAWDDAPEQTTLRAFPLTTSR